MKIFIVFCVASCTLDSCTNIKIEDCFIVSGDDCIAVKSGWDEYGIAVGMPTNHLVIRRLTCIFPDSAVIALGSEMFCVFLSFWFVAR